jgi:transposase
LQLGLNVTADGGIPVRHQPLAGNHSETMANLENLKQLRQMLPKHKLVIADCKLDTEENLLRIVAGDGQFLCAGVFTPDLQQRYLRLRKRMRPIDYCPKSQVQRPAEERDRYEAYEREEWLTGVVDGAKVRRRYRLLFVWSEAKARQEAQTRTRHTDKIREEFLTVARNLNKYSLTTRAVIVGRLEKAKGKYREGELFEYELREVGQGNYKLEWQLNQKKLQERQLLEGVYVLKTNLSRQRYPAVKALGTYKEQSQVERRFHHLKGPLAVTPMFLEKPERMAGMLAILVWSLLVLAVMERQVRRKLNGKPLYGLYPENRPSAAPTGPAILECFSTVCIVIIHQGKQTGRHLAQFTPIQDRILLLLDVSQEHLQTFMRRCGM